MKSPGKATQLPKNNHVRKLLDRYKVTLLNADKIRPSPENEELYGTTDGNDPAMPMLIRSIERIGLEEPLIITVDGYILSGHRRYYALRQLNWNDNMFPVRIVNVTRKGAADYHRLLAQYNPQRVKSVASTLAEALLNDDEDEEAEVAWTEYQKKRRKLKVTSLEAKGTKFVEPVGPRKAEFLEAAQKVIAELEDYWPLTVRQIHYRLLNEPPLTQVTKDRNERWRYENTPECYQRLSTLLVSARYHGHVDWESIDDATRETTTWGGWHSPAEFIEQQVSNFLRDYHRNHQEGQPHHIEVLVEKNTLVNIVDDMCEKFYVPLTALRGYGGPSVWHLLEMRWREMKKAYTGDGKPKCILIVLSDHDPEGLDLADDAIRSLRDCHEVDVKAIRPLLTLDQVRQYELASNPIKEGSKRWPAYQRRTGLNESWECEALDPEVIRQVLHDTILSVMDVDQLNAVQEREAEEKEQIANIRQRMSEHLNELIADGEL